MRIELIPPGSKVKFSRDYSARPSLADALREKLAAATTADDCQRIYLELCAAVKNVSSGTRRRWRRSLEARLQAIAEAQRAARAAAPLLWTPPELKPRPEEPLIVMP